MSARQVFGEIEFVSGVVGPERVIGVPWALGNGVEAHYEVRYDPRLRRYVCEELRVIRAHDLYEAPEPITTEALREIGVREMVFSSLLVDPVLRDLPNPDGREPWGRFPPEGLAKEGPTDRALRWVAHSYRYGLAIQGRPTKAVEEFLGVPRATAGRWVSKARERGFLGAAEVGKAGEE
ncbi:MAG: hypothetical protein M3Q27_11740 [Actinomycetota bacterium]|nr:hypothetical protein [Actinomycetota bacterium]